MKPSNLWYKKKRKKLIKDYGGKCVIKDCGKKTDLDFAHIKPTDLNGAGRGKNHRILDVIRNPDSYTLLCHQHHLEFDRGELKLF